MKHDISLIEYLKEYENYEEPRCSCGEIRVRKSGVTYYATCGNVKCKAINFSIAQKKNMSNPEIKERLRSKRLDYMKNNPEKTAWRLGNKQSWPEKYFSDLISNSFLKDYTIIREYSVFPYFIDFAMINQNVAIEVDGSQHLTEISIERDKKKDELLRNNGWRIYRIPATFLYYKENHSKILAEIKDFIGSDEKESSPKFLSHKEYKNLPQEHIRHAIG